VKVRDELQQALGEPIAILLKHKRMPSEHHDREYVDLIRELDGNGSITVVPSDSNIYGLIEACAVSVVIPYSSPAYISDAMGRPAIYYDPAAELVPSHDTGHAIEYAATPAELRAALARALKSATTSLLSPAWTERMAGS
jgi:polysaccharide biosynthesis PFTS motif protein